MLKRTITGFFILLTVVGFLVVKQFNAVYFDILALVIMFASLIEMVKVYNKAGKEVDYAIFLLPATICTIFNLEKGTFKAFGYVILVAVIFVLYLLTSEIITYAINRNKEDAEKNPEIINQTLFDKTKYSMMVFAYPGLVLTCIFALNHLGDKLGYMGLILGFACSMMTDTFAYLVGRCFGKRKFIPEVSPNKTIAGLIGGFLGGIVATGVCLLVFVKVPYFSETVLAKETMFILIFSVISIIGSLADQLGDLVASAVKRKIGVKDYANIFPGHGGFMDRVDGLMFTMAVIYIFFVLFLI